MPNKNTYITNIPLPIKGVVGTTLGTGTTSLALPIIHLIDQGDGYATALTDGVNIMDYTEYSFFTQSNVHETLSHFSIQPQLSLNDISYFNDTTSFQLNEVTLDQIIEETFSPNYFGHYVRLKVTAVSKSQQPIDSKLLDTYVIFHGRMHEE